MQLGQVAIDGGAGMWGAAQRDYGTTVSRFDLGTVPADTLVVHGELDDVVPLGTVLAELQWAPGHAELRSPQGERTASSLDELLEQALGSAIPVQALFAWLHGDATTAAGWQADLSRLSDGQLTAVRSAPLPRATLRIALDR